MKMICDDCVSLVDGTCVRVGCLYVKKATMKTNQESIQNIDEIYQDLIHNPVDFIIKSGMNYCEGNLFKYLFKWVNIGDVTDLEKAKKYFDILMEEESINE